MKDIATLPNLLIVDDDPLYRRLSASILSENHTIYTAESAVEGLKIMKKEPINFVISDYLMPQMTGLQFLEKIKKDYPSVEVILISESGSMDTVIESMRQGAADFFKKPFTPSDLWMALERIKNLKKLKLELTNQQKNNTVLKEELSEHVGNIIGQSRQIKEILDQIQLVAETPDTSVLIIGESGTGKELVARQIHEQSHRKRSRFGAVNMSAIPDTLFESEFFGHKKGSFTDAINDKAGWFETVNTGTLFLDEIGEMSLGLQVKLLRVLEDRKFTKVGTQSSHPFDVRIVSATNKTVAELTNGTNFRLDLFHRLGTFIIQLPPLRERKEDIPILTDHFLFGLSKKMGKSITSVHPEVYKLFSNYDFPGNIRELKNILERAVIMCKSNQLQTHHFNLLSLSNNRLANETFDLSELEKRTIIKALHKANNNKSDAAKLLNLQWNALYRRLIKYNIETCDN
jgi:DNA-binding NtrC family response regulator